MNREQDGPERCALGVEEFHEGRVVSMQVEDDRFWVRAWARLTGRPIPCVTRDFVVARNQRGDLELVPIEFGPG